MADANGVDLTQFERWYTQAGTPTVSVRAHYDADARTYTLTLSQTTPATPKQPSKRPFHIPVAVGLLMPDGQPAKSGTRVLQLTQETQVAHRLMAYH